MFSEIYLYKCMNTLTQTRIFIYNYFTDRRVHHYTYPSIRLPTVPKK